MDLKHSPAVDPVRNVDAEDRDVFRDETLVYCYANHVRSLFDDLNRLHPFATPFWEDHEGPYPCPRALYHKSSHTCAGVIGTRQYGGTDNTLGPRDKIPTIMFGVHVGQRTKRDRKWKSARIRLVVVPRHVNLQLVIYM